jgi:hypothetical protein
LEREQAAGRERREAVVVPLQSRRLERAERLTSLVDAISGLTLGFAAWERIGRGGGAAALGWAELAVSAALLVAAVLVAMGNGAVGRWIGLFAGLVFLLEALSRIYGPKGRPSLAHALNGIVLMAVAYLSPWLEERRRARRMLTLDDHGVSYRRSKLRGNWYVPRVHLVRCSIGADDAVLYTHDGRERRIDLADLHNRAEVENALIAWAAAHGVPAS